jgi:ankyrin repeat protein
MRHVEVSRDSSVSGDTPLHFASRHGHTDIVQALLASNADVNAARTQNRETALYLACKNGKTDIVQALLDSNADVNMKDDDGNKPLHVACRKGHTDVVQETKCSGVSPLTLITVTSAPLSRSARTTPV